jgi:hypothetical protein
MKSLRFSLIIPLMFFVASCATPTYYQLYKVTSVNPANKELESLNFEDENCIVSYSFWSKGGDAGFIFKNKTDRKIYLNLKETSFILNGIAFDYFKNRTFTNSLSNSFDSPGVLQGVQTGSTVSIEEDPWVYISPQSSKIISEYPINSEILIDCDLEMNPRNKDIKTIPYTLENSPLVFGNRITYEIEGKSQVMENDFYISEITNYPSSVFFESKFNEECGRKDVYSSSFFKFFDSNKFYIRYVKSTNLANNRDI